MRGQVLTFKPGDPVPGRLLSVEPRTDVPRGLSRMVEAPVFIRAGCVIDDGHAYYIVTTPPARTPVITAHLRYCNLSNEKPVVFPDGECWRGSGVVQPGDWAPRPNYVTADAPRASWIRSPPLWTVLLGLSLAGYLVGTVMGYALERIWQ